MTAKFGKKETELLIKLKHSEEYINLFKKAEGNPKQLKQAWMKISSSISMDFNYLDVKIKYNQLLSKYRVEAAETKRSGSSASSWKYWNIFNETFPSKRHFIMENVVELGNDIKIIADEKKSPKIDLEVNKKTKKTEYLEMKMSLINNLNKSLENENYENLKIIKLEEEIKKVNKRIKDLDESMRKVENNLEEILKYLCNNN